MITMMGCPIARPFESTAIEPIAGIHRRVDRGWARTVFPFTTPFRIPASVRPFRHLGCSWTSVRSHIQRSIPGPHIFDFPLRCPGVSWRRLRPVEAFTPSDSSSCIHLSLARTGDMQEVRS